MNITFLSASSRASWRDNFLDGRIRDGGFTFLCIRDGMVEWKLFVYSGKSFMRCGVWSGEWGELKWCFNGGIVCTCYLVKNV